MRYRLDTSGDQKIKNGLDTCYSAAYESDLRSAISEVAADWHETMVPRRIMWTSTARANGQLDPRCSLWTRHRPNQPCTLGLQLTP